MTTKNVSLGEFLSNVLLAGRNDICIRIRFLYLFDVLRFDWIAENDSHVKFPVAQGQLKGVCCGLMFIHVVPLRSFKNRSESLLLYIFPDY